MSSLSPRHDDHHPPQVDAYSRGPRAYHDIERILEECGGVLPELLVGNALAGDEFNCLVRERFVFSPSRSIRRWYPLSRQTMEKVGFEGRECIIPGCNGKVKGTFSSTGRVTVSVNNPCTRSAHRLSAEGSLLKFRPYDYVHLAMLDDIRVLCSAKNPVEAISNAIKRFEPTHDVLVVPCVNKTLDILRDSGYAGEDGGRSQIIVPATQDAAPLKVSMGHQRSNTSYKFAQRVYCEAARQTGRNVCRYSLKEWSAVVQSIHDADQDNEVRMTPVTVPHARLLAERRCEQDKVIITRKIPDGLGKVKLMRQCDKLLEYQLEAFSSMPPNEAMLGSWSCDIGFSLRYFSEYFRYVDLIPISMDACHNRGDAVGVSFFATLLDANGRLRPFTCMQTNFPESTETWSSLLSDVHKAIRDKILHCSQGDGARRSPPLLLLKLDEDGGGKAAAAGLRASAAEEDPSLKYEIFHCSYHTRENLMKNSWVSDHEELSKLLRKLQYGAHTPEQMDELISKLDSTAKQKFDNFRERRKDHEWLLSAFINKHGRTIPRASIATSNSESVNNMLGMVREKSPSSALSAFVVKQCDDWSRESRESQHLLRDISLAHGPAHVATALTPYFHRELRRRENHLTRFAKQYAKPTVSGHNYTAGDDKILVRFEADVQHIDPPHMRGKSLDQIEDLEHKDLAHVTIAPAPGLTPWRNSCSCSWHRSRAMPCWHIHRAFENLIERSNSGEVPHQVPGNFKHPCVLYPEAARLVVHVRCLNAAGMYPRPLDLPLMAREDVRLSSLPVGITCGPYSRDKRGLRIRSAHERALLTMKETENARLRAISDIHSSSLSLSVSESAASRDSDVVVISCLPSQAPSGESAKRSDSDPIEKNEERSCNRSTKTRRLSLASSTSATSRPVRACTRAVRKSSRHRKKALIWSPVQ